VKSLRKALSPNFWIALSVVAGWALVAKINVDDGARVRAGQVLASLDTELLEK